MNTNGTLIVYDVTWQSKFFRNDRNMFMQIYLYKTIKICRICRENNEPLVILSLESYQLLMIFRRKKNNWQDMEEI